MKYDAIVVGGGVAGLSAAAYIARSGKTVALFERQSKLGGLVQTFHRDNVYFDGGLRSIENSGIVFPMLKQLGIEIEFAKSPISIGIANTVLKLTDQSSLQDYEDFLISFYPDNASDVKAIIKEIRKIMDYMDVLYGIDNPAFLDVKKDWKYFATTIFPWMFRFLFTIRKINQLNEPVEHYLTRFSKNQSLIDIIAQHFFRATPTSFALSYFSLYLDYYYPKGGTATLIKKLTDFILSHGADIKTDTLITSMNPELKYIIDNQGNKYEYDNLVWAGDSKFLYQSLEAEKLSDSDLARHIADKRSELKSLNGADSVFTLFLTVDEKKEYFENICTGHFFYTPDPRGLSTVDKTGIEQFLRRDIADCQTDEVKESVKNYIREYIFMNTFEIAIPVLRDPDLAPEGKSGVVISLLFDYLISKKIDDCGWTPELKVYIEDCIIDAIDQSIFPGFKSKISNRFSSSPVTIERMTGNTEGAIVGWAFTNPIMPSVNKMLMISKAVDTKIPSVYQAGQWTYSPAGLPISIVTGKLAADKVLKK